MAFASEHLTCPICLDIFRQPRALFPCLHNFCEACLKDYIVDKVNRGLVNSGFECPFCRKFVAEPALNKSPQEWAALYPLNHLIVSLVDALRSHDNGGNANNEQSQSSVLEQRDKQRRVDGARPDGQSTVSEEYRETEQARIGVRHTNTSFPSLDILHDDGSTFVPTTKHNCVKYEQFVINSQTSDSINQLGVGEFSKTYFLYDENDKPAPSRKLCPVNVGQDDRVSPLCMSIKEATSHGLSNTKITQENDFPVITAQNSYYINVEYGNGNGPLVSANLPQDDKDAPVSPMELDYVTLRQDARLTDTFERHNAVYQDSLHSLEELPPPPPGCGPRHRPPGWQPFSHFSPLPHHPHQFGHIPPHHSPHHHRHHPPTFYASPRHHPPPCHPPRHRPHPHHPPPHHPHALHRSPFHGPRAHCPCSFCHAPP
ncbi:hypothetical protein CHS0354_027430 [Potamilus streckersoni]|uniref:RING-type domain-containing protein n=1 Tax=Potamilus streckersoni TaxID=2493646 RepID=A0AAE0VN24_9BIVA|nr:hypothetical protein CHS0354_027430 [Potamilus streckersoni]